MSHFLSPIVSLDLLTAPGPWTCLVAGKKVDDIAFSPNDSASCDKYWDDALQDYVPSNTFVSIGYGRRILCKTDHDVADGIQMLTVYFATAVPNGEKLSNITIYKEDPQDNGQCVTGSTTYYKYQATSV